LTRPPSVSIAGDQLVEGLAGHVLHSDESLVAAFAHFVDAADVGMLDGRGQARLTQNGGAHLLGGKLPGAENLEHHGALQLRIVGKVNHTAAASAQATLNLVVSNCLALHHCHLV
jgi:hypothetical protein